MSSPPQNFPTEPLPLGAPIPPDAAGWKQEVNERLAAHRTRRGRAAEAQTTLPLDLADSSLADSSVADPSLADRAIDPSRQQPVRSRARVAARVAERYAKAPTYSAVLAQQAETAASTTSAPVPGESSASNFPAAAERESQALLTGFLSAFEVAEEESEVVEGQTDHATHENRSAPSNLDLTVERGLGITDAGELVDAEAYGAADFIPGNLIEFPRVLVAARKARPRLAEGPLREEATVDTDPERSQLRIFEVEQQAISNIAKVDAVATEWSSIRLEALPREMHDADARLRHAQPGQTQRKGSTKAVDTALIDSNLQAAPVSDRLMAGMVDGALVALAFLGFVAVFVACTTHPPSGKPALIASACTLAAFFLLYQYLFFTYSGSTPGMRYAHIALCTFDDENPTRREMQRRIGALVLSACPLALGFAWAWFDPDRLGWHDRMSRTYQRSYR